MSGQDATAAVDVKTIKSQIDLLHREDSDLRTMADLLLPGPYFDLERFRKHLHSHAGVLDNIAKQLERQLNGPEANR